MYLRSMIPRKNMIPIRAWAQAAAARLKAGVFSARLRQKWVTRRKLYRLVRRVALAHGGDPRASLALRRRLLCAYRVAWEAVNSGVIRDPGHLARFVQTIVTRQIPAASREDLEMARGRRRR